MPTRLRHLPLVILLGLPATAWSEQTVDYHFRPFWVEPADRMEAGHGHLTTGFNHETRSDVEPMQRAAVPLEATLGLGAGFGLVLAMETWASTSLHSGGNHASAQREARLRYSLPEWRGVHVLLMTGMSQFTGDDTPRFMQGYALALDTHVGTFGFGQSWGRERGSDLQRPQETGLNFFRVGLGPESRWAAGVELRWESTADAQQLRHGLLGLGLIVGKGLMADVAIGGSDGAYSARRATAGLSWFF